MIRFIDKKNRFVELFDPNTGFYIRSGVIDAEGKDTGVDPFMRCFPYGSACVHAWFQSA